MTKRFGLPAGERLKSRKGIEALFAGGRTLILPPIRVRYLFFPSKEVSELKAGFTASRKSFKRAVDRNRVKRLLREAYRLQKENLVSALNKNEMQGHLFFMYTDSSLPDFAAIYQSVGQCLKQLQDKLPHSHENLR